MVLLEKYDRGQRVTIKSSDGSSSTPNKWAGGVMWRKLQAVRCLTTHAEFLNISQGHAEYLLKLKVGVKLHKRAQQAHWKVRAQHRQTDMQTLVADGKIVTEQSSEDTSACEFWKQGDASMYTSVFICNVTPSNATQPDVVTWNDLS